MVGNGELLQVADGGLAGSIDKMGICISSV